MSEPETRDDDQRQAAFPRAVVDDGIDLRDYFRQVADNYASMANPFGYYRALVTGLLDLPGVRIRPLYELSDASTSQGVRSVGLRHDIDADPLTALECARLLARHGVCGSFYLLHTARYYGAFFGDRFVRNAELRAWVRAFIVAGAELGIHNDCLEVYLRHGVDGAAALAGEIQWLRAQGAVIRGTVAHNSGPQYGAENFEIFRGRQLWGREVASASGSTVPIGSVAEADLGLAYEGTFATPRERVDERAAEAFFADRDGCDVRSETWMRTYLIENPTLEWGIDFQCWLVGRDAWVIASGAAQEPAFHWEVDLPFVLDFVRGAPAGSRISLIVHPEYVRGERRADP